MKQSYPSCIQFRINVLWSHWWCSCCIHFCISACASFVMTELIFNPPENHYILWALTQMIFPVGSSPDLFPIFFTHCKAIQSVFRRFKMYHCWGHLNSYVCLRNSEINSRKPAVCKKHLLEYVYNLLRLKFSFSFNQVSILEILCQNWIILYDEK